MENYKYGNNPLNSEKATMTHKKRKTDANWCNDYSKIQSVNPYFAPQPPLSRQQQLQMRDFVPYNNRLMQDFRSSEKYAQQSKSNHNYYPHVDGHHMAGSSSIKYQSANNANPLKPFSFSVPPSNSRWGSNDRTSYNNYTRLKTSSIGKKQDSKYYSNVSNECGDLKKLDMMTAADFDRDRYARFGIHESEVKDYVRTMAYKNCIECCSANYIKGKVVLVVRSGIGLLPMLCVRNGHARKVIALEQSACIEYARRIINDNHYSDRITLIQDSVHNLKSLPHGLKQVDVILSDFMGDCVLSHGVEMEQVIAARDRFLKPNGLMIPMRVTLYGQLSEQRRAYENQRIRRSEKSMELPKINQNVMDTVHDDSDLSWWRDVYGFDMRSKQSFLIDHSNNEDCTDVDSDGFLIMEPIVTYFNPKKVVSVPCVIKEFDMNTCTIAEARHVQCNDLIFKCITPDSNINGGDYAHMIELFMKVDFPCKQLNNNDFNGFSTSSYSPSTRYRQTGLLLRDQLLINDGDLFIIDEFHMWRGPQSKDNGLYETVGNCLAIKFDYSENLKLRLQYTFVNKHTNAVKRRCAYILERCLF